MSAWWRQRRSASAIPSRFAIRASLSQPAHDIVAENVCTRFAAQLPRASVGLVVQGCGPMPQRLQPFEQRPVAPLHQPVIEEQLRDVARTIEP